QTSEYIKSHEADIAASIQAAIVEPLVQKTIRKAKELKLKRILLAGGVAANSLLRQEMEAKADKVGITVYYPSLQLCMDNAAMVGAAAIPKYKAGLISPLDVNAFSQKGTKLL
ncbi:MAG: tRNA (adenosine(37)-N6)-threonylcarbamoyltransferase complex transferase subunit TsaD, partial [Candidatus Cloacimonetes bacterium]|nr:tRNA (adenosine(37)-N6)-threonylcarbamoyltransferase complex transferase subunit TsaD [Candidatus Cloacimonadota bacterium]